MSERHDDIRTEAANPSPDSSERHREIERATVNAQAPRADAAATQPDRPHQEYAIVGGEPTEMVEDLSNSEHESGGLDEASTADSRGNRDRSREPERHDLASRADPPDGDPPEVDDPL